MTFGTNHQNIIIAHTCYSDK